MIIRMKILTPLWTGDANRSSEHAQITGLVGSMRWWFEGIVRQLGGYACSPVAGQGCRYEAKGAAEDGLRSLCAACQVFGTTGWQRRFRLSVTGLQPISLFFVSHPAAYESNANWLFRIFGGDDTGGRLERARDGPRVAFGVKMLWGDELRLEFRLPVRDELVVPALLYSLWVQVAFGGIGSKTQNGFGQVDFLEKLPGGDVEAVKKLIERGKSGPGREEPATDLFNVRHCFARLYRLREGVGYLQDIRALKPIGQVVPNFQQRFLPCAFDIRYKSSARNPRTGTGTDFGLRPWIRDRFGAPVADRLLGTTRPRRDEERSASRIGVSHLYRREGNWHVKIWGHVPPGAPSRSEVERAIDEFVQDKRMFPESQLVWRWPPEKAGS